MPRMMHDTEVPPHAPARHGAKASLAPFVVVLALVVLAGVFLAGLAHP